MLIAIMRPPWRFWTSNFIVRQLSPREEKYSSIISAEDQSEQTEPFLDDDTPNFTPKTRKSTIRYAQHFTKWGTLFASITVLSLILAITVVFVKIQAPSGLQHKHSASQIMVKPCGSNPAEARRKGCHFDVISFCWLPSECYDTELSRNFYEENELEWFLDPNRTQPLTYDQIMTGEFTGLYVDWGYHLRHCTAMWKKLHRAVLGDMGRRAIDGYIGPYEHTKHCEHMLLGKRDVAFDMINTRIAVKYPDCGI